MSEIKRFTLRMDSSLFDKIQVLADNNHRTATKEIIVAIEEYLKKNNIKID